MLKTFYGKHALIEMIDCSEVDYYLFIQSIRLSEFANALSLQALDDDDIALMEIFFRNQLLDYVSGLDPVKDDYFGPFFSNVPSEFTFLPGDKKLIRGLVAHVKGVGESEKGIGHFNAKIEEKDGFSSDASAKMPILLRKLVETSIQNSTRKPNGFRYDETTKDFAAYVRMMAGPLAYETIQANLFGAIPSLPSTNRYIHRTHSTIVEGVVRCHELLQYLNERNLERTVSISEDATRIIGRVQYSRHTNQLLGFTLPIDTSTGLPVPFSYLARSFSEICQHFMANHPISEFANIVMAQPLADVTPFCLLIFGSNNKYNSDDVRHRWISIMSMLNELKIKVLTTVSDSDPKYNRAMRKIDENGSGQKIISTDWFSSRSRKPPFCLQDLYHIGTKMRNFFLKTKWGYRMLRFGQFYIDIKHVYTLHIDVTCSKRSTRANGNSSECCGSSECLFCTENVR